MRRCLLTKDVLRAVEYTVWRLNHLLVFEQRLRPRRPLAFQLNRVARLGTGANIKGGHMKQRVYEHRVGADGVVEVLADVVVGPDEDGMGVDA